MQARQVKTTEYLSEQSIKELSNEALKILEILDQIETHTAELRKRLVSELKPKSESVQIKLDQIG